MGVNALVMSGENPCQVAAFEEYLALGAKRSIKNLAPFHCRCGQEHGETQLRSWSNLYIWGKRADLFDAEVAAAEVELLVRETVLERQKAKAQRKEDQRLVRTMARRLLVDRKTGKPLDRIPPPVLRAAAWSLQMVAHEERLDLGEATSRGEQDVTEHGGSNNVVIMLPPEQEYPDPGPPPPIEDDVVEGEYRESD